MLNRILMKTSIALALTLTAAIVIATVSAKEEPPMNTPCRFTHESGRVIPCGEASIYVEETGHPDGPALILLHGGFGTMEDFNPILPALGRHFRLIGIDSRGHGKSTLGDAALSYATLAADLAQVIAALELREYSLLGFSDGGIAAYRHAIRRDPRLQKIVAVGASWEMGESDPAWEMLSGMTGDAWKEMFPDSVAAYQRLNPQPDYDRFAAAVISMWSDLSPDGYPGQRMSDVSIPMLAVRGDNDFLTHLGSFARLKALNPGIAFLNIPQTEHVAFEEAPEIFLAALGRFFGISLP